MSQKQPMFEAVKKIGLLMIITPYPTVKYFIASRISGLLVMVLLAFIPQFVSAQCPVNTSTFTSIIQAPISGSNYIYSNCYIIGRQYRLTSIDSNSTYVISYSGAQTSIITVYDSNLAVLYYGSPPLFFVAPYNGNVSFQGNTSFCGPDYECIDLMVENLGVVTCEQPSMLTASNITTNSAVLGWSETGSASAWQIEYGISGFGQDSGTLLTTNTNPVLLPNIFSGTEYEYYVRSICGVGDTSLWTGPFLFSTQCVAPLSGTYTVNSSLPTSSTNFNTLYELSNTLSKCGITGAITANVVSNSGPYQDKMDFTFIPGSSTVNTITINGNGNTINRVLIDNYFVSLDSAKHITINDFHFINQTPSFPMYGIKLTNKSDSCFIINNLIDVGMDYTSSSSAGISVTSPFVAPPLVGNYSSYLTITGNEIIGGYSGVSILGSSYSFSRPHWFVVSNNDVHDFYRQGIALHGLVNVTVDQNNISRPNRNTISPFYGINTNLTSDQRITRNRIHDDGIYANNSFPIHISQSTNLVGFESEVSNNVIYSIQAQNYVIGIHIYGTSNRVNVYHNTVNINGKSSMKGIAFSNSMQNINLRNNLVNLTGSGTGVSYGIYVGSTSTSFNSDNNNVFVNTSGYDRFGYWSSYKPTLSSWISATLQDSNSMELNPVIVDLGNGNYNPLATSIDNMGDPIGILTDIDGATRSSTTPDIGAKEFTGLAEDLAITGATLKNVSFCYGTSDSAFATISNVIGSAINFNVDSLTVFWEVNGPVNTIDSLVISFGTLASGSDTTVSISSVNMSFSFASR